MSFSSITCQGGRNSLRRRSPTSGGGNRVPWIFKEEGDVPFSTMRRCRTFLSVGGLDLRHVTCRLPLKLFDLRIGAEASFPLFIFNRGLFPPQLPLFRDGGEPTFTFSFCSF